MDEKSFYGRTRNEWAAALTLTGLSEDKCAQLADFLISTEDTDAYGDELDDIITDFVDNMGVDGLQVKSYRTPACGDGCCSPETSLYLRMKETPPDEEVELYMYYGY